MCLCLKKNPTSEWAEQIDVGAFTFGLAVLAIWKWIKNKTKQKTSLADSMFHTVVKNVFCSTVQESDCWATWKGKNDAI